MAAQEQQEETHQHFDDHFAELLTTYLGLSFAVFLGFLPKNSIPLISTYQAQNKLLSSKLTQAEEQLKQLHSRRKEDSKANARVVEIFASHRHAWQEQEKRLLQQIDDCNDEIAFLKSKLEDFEGVEAEFKASIEDLKREVRRLPRNFLVSLSPSRLSLTAVVVSSSSSSSLTFSFLSQWPEEAGRRRCWAAAALGDDGDGG